MLRELVPDISDIEIDKQISTSFPSWFKEHVCVEHETFVTLTLGCLVTF